MAFIAAAAATAFSIELGTSYRRRKRPHALAWTAAMGAYAAATWALFFGLTAGWNDLTFRTFYLLGAIVNIPLLAVGSVYLVVGERAGRRVLVATLAFLAFGLWLTLSAPLIGDIEGVGIPAGSEVFDFTFDADGATLPGPRIPAAIAGGLASLAIIGLAGYSAIRFWKTKRQLALGNLLIIAGTFAPTLGGSLTAFGEGAALSISLLLGAVLLWAGYRVASGARSSETSSV